MSSYDASIRIDTKINTKNAQTQLSTLENRIVKTADKIASLQEKLKSLKADKAPTEEYAKFKSQLLESYSTIEKLEKKQKRLASDLKGLSVDQLQEQAKAAWNEFDKVEEKLNRLDEIFSNIENKRNKLLKDNPELLEEDPNGLLKNLDDEYNKVLAPYEKLQEQSRQIQHRITEINEAIKFPQEIEKARDSAGQLEEKLKSLEESGRAFTFGKSEEIAKTEQQLKYAENDLSALTQKHEVLELKQEKAAEGYKKLGDTAKKSLEKINNSQKKSIGLLGSFGKQLKSIIAATFIFNTIRKAFSSLIKGIKEGFENLYEGNERFKNSVDSLKASALTLKNSLAAAFAPLVEIAIPYIQRFVEWITKAVNMVGQFIAALTGRKTYTKAIKQTAKASDDAAKSTEKEADAMEEAQEAAEGYLNPLDEIHKYKEKEIKSPKAKKEDEIEEPEAGPETMFEEIPIDSRILDFLQKLKDFIKPVIDYAQKLKDIFMQGFFDGLGDWEYRWQSIKDSIASIKDSLIDIFTDPAVLAAANGWAQSVAYMLGSLAGSMASIGLTIATNLLGGIEKYLQQNTERIKKYLISMFNIWEEVNYMFAGFFESIAYVFEAFASEQGQQLTANIIGIFVDAFMGITELASKFFRDLAQLIIQPFVDNKEGFRTALEGFLVVLSEVTGTIKQGIDETFDKLNEVYDAHFKPFFDSVAQGLSDLVGSFLEFWNGTVQPILEDWAEKFDVLWKEHIQPLLNSVADLLGSIADLLKTLWEQVLQPFIQWIIDNILPIVLPIIQAIYDTLVTVIGDIADFLTGFVNTVKGIIDLIVALINGDWSAAWEAAKSIVENIFNMIFSFIQTIIDSLLGVIDVGLQAILGIFETIFQGIFDFISKIWNDIKEYTTSFFEWIGGHIESALSDIKGVWDNIWDSFTEKVTSIWENIKNIVSRAIENIKSWVSGLFSIFGGVSSKAGSISSRSGMAGGGYYTSMARAAMPSVLYGNPAFAALSTMEIPAYATGQVIPRTMRQHLAILGDNPRETEIVSPLSTMKQALKEAMMEMGGANRGNSQPIILKVILNGKDILYAMVKEGKIVQMSTGRNIFALE